MGEREFLALTPQGLIVAAFLLGVVALAAVKLFWGMAQWTRPPQHRVGDRWGDEPAEVVEWSGETGYVRAGGELWRARSQDALAPGEKVKVARTNGLMLDVRKDPKA
ncbi:MAG: NfeD family protein [Amphiplicatus sp.]